MLCVWGGIRESDSERHDLMGYGAQRGLKGRLIEILLPFNCRFPTDGLSEINGWNKCYRTGHDGTGASVTRASVRVWGRKIVPCALWWLSLCFSENPN